MIEFKGEMTGKCKKYTLRRAARIALITGIVLAVIFGIPLVICAFTIHWVFFLSIPGLILAVLLGAKTPDKNVHDMILPTSIKIDPESNTLVSKSNKFYDERSIDEITHIVDYGDWYNIFFKRANEHFVCQKDLIYQVTLEDFETLFEDKIVRK